MAGTPLDQFTDFFLTTGPLILTDPSRVINEAQRRTYVTSRIMGTDNMTDMVQGGETIRDDIYFDVASSYLHYDPNEEFSYDNPQVVTQWSVPWRFTKVDLVFTDQEVGLNTGDLNRGAMFHQFKRLRRIKEQNMWTDLCNGFEQDLFRTPDSSTMEASGGKIPYSLFTYYTEWGADPAANAEKSVGTMPPGFSTVQGISSTDEGRWTNPVEFYSEVPDASASGGWDLFPAFSRMYYRMRFNTMPKRPEFSESSEVGSCFIMASLRGVAMYEDGLRQFQDTFRGGVNPSDPSYGSANYRGIGMDYIENMDFAAVYSTDANNDPSNGTSGVGAGEFDNSTDEFGNALPNPAIEGPRFTWLNPKYTRKVLKRDRFLYQQGPFFPSRQPFTRIVVVDTWHNNISRSRQRGGGLVSPRLDVLP